jgi:hypothetical protein
MVDRGGGDYDFAPIAPLIDAMNAAQILPVWDLCHYGYPDDADPFAPDFAERFARYCRACAEYLTARVPGPHYFTPINEITYWGYGGGEWGWMAPHGRDRATRLRLRHALCAASIAGVRAIREVEPGARMVHVEPLIQVVAPADRPDLAEEARHEREADACFAWDVLAGRVHPELGGAPEVLDIVGANCYAFGQMEYRESGPHVAMAPRRRPHPPALRHARRRVGALRAPMIVAETSGLGVGRPAWLKDVMEESLAAVDRGIDLHGMCLFPRWTCPTGTRGVAAQRHLRPRRRGRRAARVPFAPYVEELRRWQRLLNRVTVLDEDPFSDPVELADVVAAARRLRTTPDQDWS